MTMVASQASLWRIYPILSQPTREFLTGLISVEHPGHSKTRIWCFCTTSLICGTAYDLVEKSHFQSLVVFSSWSNYFLHKFQNIFLHSPYKTDSRSTVLWKKKHQGGLYYGRQSNLRTLKHWLSGCFTFWFICLDDTISLDNFLTCITIWNEFYNKIMMCSCLRTRFLPIRPLFLHHGCQKLIFLRLHYQLPEIIDEVCGFQDARTLFK